MNWRQTTSTTKPLPSELVHRARTVEHSVGLIALHRWHTPACCGVGPTLDRGRTTRRRWSFGCAVEPAQLRAVGRVWGVDGSTATGAVNWWMAKVIEAVAEGDPPPAYADCSDQSQDTHRSHPWPPAGPATAHLRIRRDSRPASADARRRRPARRPLSATDAEARGDAAGPHALRPRISRLGAVRQRLRVPRLPRHRAERSWHVRVGRRVQPLLE